MSPHAHSCRREPIAAKNCIRPAVAIRRRQLDSVNQFSGVVDVPGGSPPRLMPPKTLAMSPIPMVVNTRPDHQGHVLIRAKAYRPAAIPACRGSHICACRWRNVLVSRNAPGLGKSVRPPVHRVIVAVVMRGQTESPGKDGGPSSLNRTYRVLRKPDILIC